MAHKKEKKMESGWRSKKMKADPNSSVSLDIVKACEIVSVPGQLNPLQMDYLVAEILNYLDMSTLKQCRLVCKIWAMEGGKQLLYKSKLKSGFRRQMKVSEKQRYAGSLSQFLTLTGSSKSLKISIGQAENLRLLEREPGIYDRVKMLSFNKIGQTSLKSEIDLIQILNKLPNLKILDTKTFPLLFSDTKEFKNDKPENSSIIPEPNQKLDLFLDKIQSLEILNLDMNLTPDLLLSLIPYKDKFNNSLRRIQMNNRLCCEISFALHILIHNQLHLNWKLSTISISISSQQISSNLVRKFLESFSTSLKVLKITFFEPRYFHYRLNQDFYDNNNNNDDDENNGDSGTGSWYIPSNLKQLKILEILRGFDNCSYVNRIDLNSGSGEDEMDNKYGIWESLLVAFQLPGLKKLVLGYLPSDLDSRIRQEQANQFYASPVEAEDDDGKKEKVLSRILRNESLEEMELNINVYEGLYPALAALTSPDLWPGLKSLKIDCFIDPPPLESPESGSTCFLSNWTRIERLDLQFLFTQKNIHLFEDWLTGRYGHRYCNSSGTLVSLQNDKQDFETRGFYLKDLKNLKHLMLRGPVYGIYRLNQPFTDFLIQNSLKFMTNLQSLYFRNATIGDDALTALKDSLGAHVAVVLDYDRYFNHA